MKAFNIGSLYKRVTAWSPYMMEDPDEPRIISVENIIEIDNEKMIVFYYLEEPEYVYTSRITHEEGRWEQVNG